MKRLLVVALVVLSACHRQPQEIATKNMEVYLKKKFNNPDSFKFVLVNSLVKDWRQPAIDSGFVRLDSGFVEWSYMHQKSKTDHKVIEMYVDSLNKARPDLAKENIRNLKLIESGKLDSYYANCTFTMMIKGKKKSFNYSFQLDTTYNIIKADDLTGVLFE